MYIYILYIWNNVRSIQIHATSFLPRRDWLPAILPPSMFEADADR